MDHLSYFSWLFTLLGVIVSVVTQTCAPGECSFSEFDPDLTVSPSLACYNDGSSVNLTCPVKIGGPPFNSCNNGNWVYPQATCEGFTCQHPNVTEDVEVTPNKTSYIARDTITYSCEENHVLVGPSTSMCDSQNTWNSPTIPICLAACSDPDIENGNTSFAPPFSEGDSTQVVCNPGSRLEHNISSTLICRNFSWGYIPRCIAFCNVSISKGFKKTNFLLEDGESKIVECDDGYSYGEGSSSISVNCTALKHKITLECFADCPVIATISNGSVTYDTYHGAIAKVSCDQGYSLKDTETSVCIDGTWTPEIATCEEVTASTLQGEMSTFNPTTTMGGVSDATTAPVVPVTCAPGECSASAFDPDLTVSPSLACYNDGSSVNLTCPSPIGGPPFNHCDNGNWLYPQATCEGFTCQRPNVTDDVKVTPDKVSYIARDVITYSCGPNQYLFGPSTAICDEQDEWNPATIPICPATCNQPEIENGYTFLPPPFSEGDSTYVICNPGSRLEPNVSTTTIICQNSSWGYIPQCVAFCNVSISTGSNITEFLLDDGESTIVECLEGYSFGQISTSISLNCTNGILSHQIPLRCFADCPVIARIKNGSVTYDTYHGAIANVSCVPGYFLKGTGMSTCIDGTWTPAIATCEATEASSTTMLLTPQANSTAFSETTQMGSSELYTTMVSTAQVDSTTFVKTTPTSSIETISTEELSTNTLLTTQADSTVFLETTQISSTGSEGSSITMLATNETDATVVVETTPIRSTELYTTMLSTPQVDSTTFVKTTPISSIEPISTEELSTDTLLTTQADSTVFPETTQISSTGSEGSSITMLATTEADDTVVVETTPIRSTESYTTMLSTPQVDSTTFSKTTPIRSTETMSTDELSTNTLLTTQADSTVFSETTQISSTEKISIDELSTNTLLTTQADSTVFPETTQISSTGNEGSSTFMLATTEDSTLVVETTPIRSTELYTTVVSTPQVDFTTFVTTSPVRSTVEAIGSTSSSPSGLSSTVSSTSNIDLTRSIETTIISTTGKSSSPALSTDQHDSTTSVEATSISTAEVPVSESSAGSFTIVLSTSETESNPSDETTQFLTTYKESSSAIPLTTKTYSSTSVTPTSTAVQSCPYSDLPDDIVKTPMQGEYVDGANVTFSCRNGFILDGISSSSCMNGYWVPQTYPSCIAFREIEDQLNNIINKTFTSNASTDDITEAAEIIEIATSDVRFVIEDVNRINQVLDSLENIVGASDASINVTVPVVEIANNVMEFDVNLLVDISGRIVSALEQQITAYQESDTNENVTVVFPNIGIQAVKVNVEHLESSLVYGHILPVGQITSINDELTQGNARLLVGPEETSGDRTTALISIPKSALEEADLPQSTLPISLAVYRNAKLFVSSEVRKQERVASQIISAKVEGGTLQNLTNNSEISTKFLTNVQLKKREIILSRECVFWAYDEVSMEGVWSTDGCNREADEFDLTVCKCNHLTSFAILVTVGREIDWIIFAGTIFSVAWLCLTIFGLLFVRALRLQQSTFIDVNLCVALCGLYISYFLSFESVVNYATCVLASTVVHYFCLAVSSWLTISAFHVYWLFDKPEKSSIKQFSAISCFLAYGLPLLPVLFIAIFTQILREIDFEYCFISDGPSLIAGLLVILGIMLLLSCFLYSTVIKKGLDITLTQTSPNRSQAGRRKTYYRVRNGIIIWFFFLLSLIFGYLVFVSPETNAFEYLYAVTISLKSLTIIFLLCFANVKYVKLTVFRETQETQGSWEDVSESTDGPLTTVEEKVETMTHIPLKQFKMIPRPSSNFRGMRSDILHGNDYL